MQPPQPMWQNSPPVLPPMEPPGPTWGVLRAVSIFIKVVAFIELVVGVIASFLLTAAGVNAQNSFGGGNALTSRDFLVALIGIVVSIILFLFIYAAGDLIMLLVHIERNTRRRL